MGAETCRSVRFSVSLLYSLSKMSALIYSWHSARTLDDMPIVRMKTSSLARRIARMTEWTEPRWRVREWLAECLPLRAIVLSIGYRVR